MAIISIATFLTFTSGALTALSWAAGAAGVKTAIIAALGTGATAIGGGVATGLLSVSKDAIKTIWTDGRLIRKDKINNVGIDTSDGLLVVSSKMRYMVTNIYNKPYTIEINGKVVDRIAYVFVLSNRPVKGSKSIKLRHRDRPDIDNIFIRYMDRGLTVRIGRALQLEYTI